MWKRWLLCAFAALCAAAAAGESQGENPTPEPRPKSKAKGEPQLPAPNEDELDKPDKTGAPRPTEIPTKDAPPAQEKEQDKGSRPGHVNPFRDKPKLPPYARPARITYSDKKVLEGSVWARSDKPLRVFNRAAKAHQDYFLSDLKRIDVAPESENFERDWRWKNQGSSEKVFLDTGYFWNQYVTTFTLTNGEKPAGDCSGQFTIQLPDGQRESWFLYKRQSGGDDRTKAHKKREETEALVYVKSVEFIEDSPKKGEQKSP
jgi:hypothetical protein